MYQDQAIRVYKENQNEIIEYRLSIFFSWRNIHISFSSKQAWGICSFLFHKQILKDSNMQKQMVLTLKCYLSFLTDLAPVGWRSDCWSCFSQINAEDNSNTLRRKTLAGVCRWFNPGWKINSFYGNIQYLGKLSIWKYFTETSKGHIHTICTNVFLGPRYVHSFLQIERWLEPSLT